MLRGTEDILCLGTQARARARAGESRVVELRNSGCGRGRSCSTALAISSFLNTRCRRLLVIESRRGRWHGAARNLLLGHLQIERCSDGSTSQFFEFLLRILWVVSAKVRNKTMYAKRSTYPVCLLRDTLCRWELTIVVSFTRPKVRSADGCWGDWQARTVYLGGKVGKDQTFSALKLSICRRGLRLNRGLTTSCVGLVEPADVTVNALDIIPRVLTARGPVLPGVISRDLDDRGGRTVDAGCVVGRWNNDSRLGSRVRRVEVFDESSGRSSCLSFFPRENRLGLC